MGKNGRIMTRARAVRAVLVAAAVLLLLLGLRLLADRADSSTPQGRLRFLERLGWQVDPASEEHRSIRLPDELGEVLENYNEMQKAQGYDLARHLGERCEQYSYRVTNYPDCGQEVWVTLYVRGRRVIAGDVHSTALDGFLHGLKLN